MIFLGIIIGLLIGVIVGFYMGVVGAAMNEKTMAKNGVAKLDGKYYFLVPVNKEDHR